VPIYSQFGRVSAPGADIFILAELPETFLLSVTTPLRAIGISKTSFGRIGIIGLIID
jgi:hypothetical protein